MMIGSGLPAIGQSPPEPKPPVVEGPVQYVGPDTYLLLDAQGRPQPVLGMSYEEFMAAWKKTQHLDSIAAEPRYAIESLRITGRVVDDHAEADATITIRLATDEPVRIPLGMASAILRDPPRWESAAEQSSENSIEYSSELGGFVASIRGAPDATYTVTLPVFIPLAHDGNETTLRLNSPRALVSNLSLEVQTQVLEATVGDGSLVARRAATDGATVLTVDGLPGDFQLNWNTAESQNSEVAAVLTATGQIAIAIDGHSIRSDARLSVGSYGGSFERFRVRLPPGAQLIQNRPNEGATPPAYRMTLETNAEKSTSDSQTVLVELAEPQAGPVEVAISTEQPLGLPGEELAMELAGFEVIGALRQYGDVAVHVADDWQLRWQIGPRVRQVERTDVPAALQATQPTVAFQYDRQPWSLRASVTARPLRVHVAPQYTLELEPNEARLRVQLIYQIPGARAFEYRIRLNGWELTSDPIESNGLVDRDGVVVTRDGVLVLPLAQASTRRAEIGLSLRRDSSPDSPSIELPLPIPNADSVASADVTVSAAPGIELSPNLARSRGLSPTPISADTPPPPVAAGRTPFRYRSFLPDAVFAAERTFRERVVDAAMASELKIDRRQIEVTQIFHYAVRNQPLDRISIEVPALWSIADGEAELVPVAAMTGENAGARERLPIPLASELGVEDGQSRRLEIPLPQPRFGRFDVRLRFQAPMPADAPSTGRINLPLPLPRDARVSDHRVSLPAPSDLSATLDSAAEDSTWQTVAAESSMPNPPTTEFIAQGPAASLPLLLQPIARGLPQATVVQRIWLQTWRAGNTIQDRAAFRFQTIGTSVTVELPPLVAPESVEALLDGQLANVASRERGRLLVNLPTAGDAAQVPHTLELRFRRPARIGMVVRDVFTPPQLVGSSALHEAYWHVVLPGDTHVVRSPAALVPVARWQWFDVFWGRTPTKSQAELEQWIGASTQTAPPAAQSEYLYSGLSPVASVEIVTAPRWLIVLAASGAALAVVLLWMFVPMLRRPWVVLLIAVAIAALATAYPAPALLLAQASVLGWIAATVAVALRRRASDSTIRHPITSPGSTNLRIRPLSRPDSMVTPAVPAASGAPTAPLTEAER